MARRPGRGQRFGPTLVAEHLAEEFAVVVPVATLRRWMVAAGLWSRRRHATPPHPRRVRRAHFGELVQLDGSVHAWLEGRAAPGWHLTMVDDATSRTLGLFTDGETTWGASSACMARTRIASSRSCGAPASPTTRRRIGI